MSMKHKITHGTFVFLMKRSKRRCEWCGSKHEIGIDHIRPRCLGGTNQRRNLQVLCNKCGTWKGGDSPDRIIRRIRRLKVKSEWHRSVKSEGLKRMSEFVDRERESAESESVDTFENPLKIVLGNGTVQLQAMQSTEGVCLVFGLHGERGEVGSFGETILGDELRKNQVCVVCANRRGAEALHQAIKDVIGHFEMIERMQEAYDGTCGDCDACIAGCGDQCVMKPREES